LTYVIPKYYCEKDHRYQIEMPGPSDFVKSINDIPIPVTVIKARGLPFYYLNIPITENLLCDCNLILEVSKLSLSLSPVQDCDRDIKCQNSWK
jgi:hypothetical protein